MSNVIYPKRYDPDNWFTCPICVGDGCAYCDGRGLYFLDEFEPEEPPSLPEHEQAVSDMMVALKTAQRTIGPPPTVIGPPATEIGSEDQA